MANVSEDVASQLKRALADNPNVPEAMIDGLLDELADGGGNSDRLAELIRGAVGDTA